MRIAIIPARGGSKRIPRKNIRLFAGKPIIAYSIEAALGCGLFDHVLVSTDDPEIAEVAKANGAEIPFLRPTELSDDYTGTNAVTVHAIHWYQGQGASLDQVCCIYATAPFLKAEALLEGYERLVASNKSFAFAVTSFPFPIQRAVRLNQRGEVEAMYPEFRDYRSQDLEPAYHDAGQFYWGLPHAFIEEVPMFSPAAMPVILPRHLVQDIDTEEDWLRAEWMYKSMRAAGQT